MTTFTRTLIAEPHRDLASITRTIGKMRTDISHRYGALASTRDELIRFKSECAKRYGHLAVDGTIRNQTIIDTLNKIKAAREAANVPVKRASVVRTKENEEGEIRLFTLLNRNKWTRDSFLHRQMRMHFRHGQNPNCNQYSVWSDKHSETVTDGKLVITIHIAAKHGNDIRLATNTTGEGIELTDDNLRIVLRDGFVEIHYGLRKGPGRICVSATIGVDKGYTEALADSDGHFHGRKFGKILGNLKGVHAEALESVTKQHSANLVLVNAAYSSQVNNRTGYLEGKRQGDRVITPTGEVLHSDVNAARNVRDRIHDSEITRYMPFDKVRKIFCDVPPGAYCPSVGPSRVSSDTSTGCGYSSLLGNE